MGDRGASSTAIPAPVSRRSHEEGGDGRSPSQSASRSFTVPIRKEMKVAGSDRRERHHRSRRKVICALTSIEMLQDVGVSSKTLCVSLSMKGHLKTRSTVRAHSIPAPLKRVSKGTVIPLDMVFTMQYMHHFKKEVDTLRISVEKRRFKTRVMKSIASAEISLGQVVQRHFEGPIELLSRKKDKRRDRRIPVMLLTCRLDSIPFDQLIDLVEEGEDSEEDVALVETKDSDSSETSTDSDTSSEEDL